MFPKYMTSISFLSLYEDRRGCYCTANHHLGIRDCRHWPAAFHEAIGNSRQAQDGARVACNAGDYTRAAILGGSSQWVLRRLGCRRSQNGGNCRTDGFIAATCRNRPIVLKKLNRNNIRRTQTSNRSVICSFARRIDPLCLTRLPLPGKRCHAVV